MLLTASTGEDEFSSTVHDRFASAVRSALNRPAIVGVARPLTFGELDQLAGGYESAIARQTNVGGRVALLLAHGAPVIAASLGALRSGCSVLVLNPDDPPRRLASTIERLEASAVVVGEDYQTLAGAMDLGSTEVIFDEMLTEPPNPVPIAGYHGPDDVAFFLQVPGASGVPTLVQWTHRAVLHNAHRYSRGVGLLPDDRTAWLTSMSGGQGLATVWANLLAGATLCPYPEHERGLVEMADWLELCGATTLDTVPSIFRQFARTLHDGRLLDLRAIRLASEPTTRADFDLFRQRVVPSTRLYCMFGTSETGLLAHASFKVSDDPDKGRLPISEPAEGVVLTVTDTRGEAVSDGEVGQLIVQSQFLSLGYWKDPSLSHERFVDVNGVPTFRTGDLTSFAPGRGYVFAGRIDTQLTVHGCRVLPEEVESVILAYPGISGSAVVAHSAESEAVSLAAFVVAEQGQSIDLAHLRQTLRDTLPAHAVPIQILALESLPTTADGTIDRATLADIRAKASEGPPAASETEDILAELWRSVFGIDTLDLRNTFFEAGGDATTARTVAALVDELFEVELDLDLLATNPTPADMAAAVHERREARGGRVGPPPVKRDHSGPHPLSFAQRPIWRRICDGDLGMLKRRPTAFVIRGPLVLSALEQSLQHVVDRHAILRTTFADVDGVPWGSVRSSHVVDFQHEVIRSSEDPDEFLLRLLATESNSLIDFESGPIVRFRLAECGADDYRFIYSDHPLVADAYSWDIVMDDLTSAYGARLAGRQLFVDDQRLQFSDVALWERARRAREPVRHSGAVDHWHRIYVPPVPAIEAPFGALEDTDRDGPPIIRWGLRPEISMRLSWLASQQGATYFVSRLAPFAAMLAQDRSVDELLIGAGTSMRAKAELQRVVGPMMNFVALRLDDLRSGTFRQLLGRVRTTFVQALEFADVPFGSIVPDLIAQGVTPSNVNVRLAAVDRRRLFMFGGSTCEPLFRITPDPGVAKLGINRTFEEDGCWMEFDPAQQSAEAVRSFADRLERFIEMVTDEPDRLLGDIYLNVPR